MKAHKIFAIATCIIGLLHVAQAQAGSIPYPTSGTLNPSLYTFTATNTGLLTAYFAGSSAGYDEKIGLLINGVDTGVYGLDDHTSSVGQSISWGVSAGDVLTFIDNVSTSGDVWYSNPTLNVDLGNHIYSTAYTGGISGIPVTVGTYVAFEDLRFPGSDFNYHDDTFVFTNVSTSVANDVPEPTSIALLAVGLFGFCASRRKAGQS